MKREIILAIETGISPGSLSILKKGSEIDYWIGERKISRSEDLLANIEALFKRNGIDKLQTKRIAVSIGPGSFSGVRVGIATALGLAKALECDYAGISVLEALTAASRFPGKIITAFGLGENEVCWQIFETSRTNSAPPQTGFITEFEATLKDYSNSALIVTQDLHKDLSKRNDFAGHFAEIVSVENPAKCVALKSEEITLNADISPLYMRDARIS
jgi:tRNA threonylcarbamoyl adenosine modification protein YeaZ